MVPPDHHGGSPGPSEAHQRSALLRRRSGNGQPEKVAGAIVVRLGMPRIRKPGAPSAGKLPDGAAAVITVDSLAGPEPPIWPLPYAAVFSLRDEARPLPPRRNPLSRFDSIPPKRSVLFAGSGHSLAELQTKLDNGASLPNFSLVGKLEADLTVKEQDFTSDNILGCLAGLRSESS